MPFLPRREPSLTRDKEQMKMVEETTKEQWGAMTRSELALWIRRAMTRGTESPLAEIRPDKDEG